MYFEGTKHSFEIQDGPYVLAHFSSLQDLKSGPKHMMHLVHTAMVLTRKPANDPLLGLSKLCILGIIVAQGATKLLVVKFDLLQFCSPLIYKDA